MTADEIIAALKLEPHPEGGWFRETWRADAHEGERAAGTAIFYLLKAGERSHWHRVDAAEIWHHYAGAPLRLSLSRDGETHKTAFSGPIFRTGKARSSSSRPMSGRRRKALGTGRLSAAPSRRRSNFQALRWPRRAGRLAGSYCAAARTGSRRWASERPVGTPLKSVH